MSVVVKVSVRKQYNELLTAFARTVSEWGKSKRNLFPKEKEAVDLFPYFLEVDIATSQP